MKATCNVFFFFNCWVFHIPSCPQQLCKVFPGCRGLWVSSQLSSHPCHPWGLPLEVGRGSRAALLGVLPRASLQLHGYLADRCEIIKEKKKQTNKDIREKKKTAIRLNVKTAVRKVRHYRKPWVWWRRLWTVLWKEATAVGPPKQAFRGMLPGAAWHRRQNSSFQKAWKWKG